METDKTYDDKGGKDVDDGHDPGPREEEEAGDREHGDADQPEVNKDGEAVGTEVVDHFADEFFHLGFGVRI
jgi:hypothetical protein